MSRESKQFERGDSTSSNRSELQDSKGVLFKRKDYLDTDEKAKSHPNRTYYYKRHHNLDEVIETCTKKLQVSHSLYLCLIKSFSNYSIRMMQRISKLFTYVVVLTSRKGI
jgi:hypothetical protein